MRISTATIQESGVGNMVYRQTRRWPETQEEISTGLRLLKPSDDPAAMAYALDINASISINTRYQKNIEAVQLRLNNQDSALEASENILNRVRELTVTGLNDSYNASDRGAMAKEIGELTGALLDVGNAQNDKGEYIFSGSLSKEKPFDFDNTKNPPIITYRGDAYKRIIQTGPNIFMRDGNNGFDVFQDIPSADKSLASASITTGGSTTTAATDAATDATGTTDVTAPPADTAATPVDTGTTPEDTSTDTTTTPPAATTATSTRSIFNTLLKLKELFESPLADADLHAGLNAALKDLDTGLNRLSDTRVDVGARLNTLDQQYNILGKFILDSRKSLSEIQDADYAQTISSFNFQQMALQASQQAYVKVKGLSLFNYL